MPFTTAFALIATTSVVLAHPLHHFTARDEVAAFPAGQTWDILLAAGGIGKMKTTAAADNFFSTIDIDLFDTDAATIAGLKQSKKVICYFSAGSKEGWRPDAGDFQDGDTGKELDGWPDEVWTDVKSENVRSIMKKRIQKAKEIGCDAVDPDNVDGFVSSCAVIVVSAAANGIT